ncbi:cystatin-like [Dendropsophus ebraccatus]|uniref:cystatin-like n=1 Tax=Dendropsophus ebraccatus TaxID=150705 RepID=UPI00383174A9
MAVIVYTCLIVAISLFPAISSTQAGNDAIIGGYNGADVNDMEVIKAAKFAVKEYNKKHNNKYKLIQITSAEKQVVNGYNYKMYIKIGKRRCKKDYDSLSCDSEYSKILNCRFVVYKSLQGSYTLTSQQCTE